MQRQLLIDEYIYICAKLLVAYFIKVYTYTPCLILRICTVQVAIYRMDLNFRGTKLSRIEKLRVFRVFIFADARPTIL